MSKKETNKANSSEIINKDSEALTNFKYKQELKRNLKLFSSFAVAFSFISITTGIFTNYQYLLATGGPAGIWSWIITFVGQVLVALIFAELASVMPISGYSYQWVKKLSSHKLGWLTGWICLCYFILIVPAIDSGLAAVVASLIGIEATTFNVTMIVMITLIIQAVLNIVGVKLATVINNAAVFTESIGIIILTIILVIIALKNGNDISILTNTGNAATGTGYIMPFALSVLMSAFTLVGFETAANLSEETVNASKTVPKAIVGAIVLSGILGLLFLIAVTFAIKDLPTVLASDNPLPLIIESNLGTAFGKIFLVVISISIFACGTVSMTSGSRFIYALARDDAFFFNNKFKKISHNTSAPVAATVLILVLGIMGTIFSGSLSVVVGVTTILPTIIYLITAVSYGMSRKKIQFKKGDFNLGKASKPIFISAVIWLIFELGILTIPEQYNLTALIAIGLIAIGFILYSLVFKKKLEESINLGVDIAE